jgi:hypothetical protein
MLRLYYSQMPNDPIEAVSQQTAAKAGKGGAILFILRHALVHLTQSELSKISTDLADCFGQISSRRFQSFGSIGECHTAQVMIRINLKALGVGNHYNIR